MMKITFFLLSIFLLASISTSVAQDVQNINEKMSQRGILIIIK